MGIGWAIDVARIYLMKTQGSLSASRGKVCSLVRQVNFSAFV